MILPPYLIKIGYEEVKSIKTLTKLSYKEEDGALYMVEPWYYWRDIFEYIACIEFAKKELYEIPTGKELRSIHILSARYHSASMIFYAQATLDSLVYWVCKFYNIELHRSQKVFHKESLQREIKKHLPTFEDFYSDRSTLVKEIEEYRNEWIHRISGGAKLYSDKSPEEPDANIRMMIPIYPKIDSYDINTKLEKIQKMNTEKGSWLISLDEFSDKYGNGTVNFVLDFLELLLNNEKVEGFK